MVKGLYTAYSGMLNEQHRMDVLSNNMANVTTVGFKKEGTTSQSFDDVLAVKIKDSTVGYNNVQREGLMQPGVKIGENYIDWSEGSFKVTGNTYDIAIAGEGFFALEFTNKAGETTIKYTRDGAFTVDLDGYLRTSDGDYVLTQEGALNSQGGEDNYVQIDPNLKYQISPDGTIRQNGEEVTTIGIIDIENYDYINKYGENLYDLIEGGTIIESEATVQQGMLEASNVNVIDEMVSMITIARAYEAGQKMIQTEDSTLEKTANQVGNV